MKKKPIILLLFVIVCSSLLAQGNPGVENNVKPIPEFDDLYRFRNIYISSQPEVARLTWLKDHGVKTVINLRSEEEIDDFKEAAYDEQFVAEKLGFNYYSLPIDGNAGFTAENQSAFNGLMDADIPTLVHCQSGGRATYLFIAYLIQVEGYSLQEAVNIGRQMKYNSPLEQLMDVEFIIKIDSD